jgi:hypothetical protein
MRGRISVDSKELALQQNCAELRRFGGRDLEWVRSNGQGDFNTEVTENTETGKSENRSAKVAGTSRLRTRSVRWPGKAIQK